MQRNSVPSCLEASCEAGPDLPGERENSHSSGSKVPRRCRANCMGPQLPCFCFQTPLLSHRHPSKQRSPFYPKPKGGKYFLKNSGNLSASGHSVSMVVQNSLLAAGSGVRGVRGVRGHQGWCLLPAPHPCTSPEAD